MLSGGTQRRAYAAIPEQENILFRFHLNLIRFPSECNIRIIQLNREAWKIEKNVTFHCN